MIRRWRPGATQAFRRIAGWTISLPTGPGKYRRDGSGSRILPTKSRSGRRRSGAPDGLLATVSLLRNRFDKADSAADGRLTAASTRKAAAHRPTGARPRSCLGTYRPAVAAVAQAASGRAGQSRHPPWRGPPRVGGWLSANWVLYPALLTRLLRKGSCLDMVDTHRNAK